MSALKIAVVTGGHSYEVQPFHALFRALPGVDAYIQHLDDFTSSPQAVRDGYDAIVFYIMPRGAPSDESPWFSGKPKSAFEHLGETSQGIVMLHHAILAYPAWPVWDELVGMTDRVISEYSHGEQIPVHVAQPEHPIVQGVAPWTITDETYVLHDPGPGNEIILTTDHPRCMKALAWVRTYRHGRVFCYQSGHDHLAFEDASFQAVLLNGIRWVSRFE
jgi:hypothetical protein